MNGTMRGTKGWRKRGWRPGVAAVVPVFFMALVGCADPRMSPEEFHQLQQEARHEARQAAEDADESSLTALLDQQLGPYAVGAEDVLSVTLTAADADAVPPPFQVRVNHEGEVVLPMVGRLKIGGLELVDAEAAIQTAYVPGYLRDAAVHVELVSQGTVEVLVQGAVELPGLVRLGHRHRDLLHALVAAGGVSQTASGQATLQRIRHPSETVALNLSEPEGIRRALALAPLEQGDVVRVAAATPNTVFVGGLVNLPRPQEYPPGVKMTVMQALAAAGGLRTDIFPKEATLVRRMPDGSDARVKLNLDRIYAGTDENLVLAAGDILWVPHTVETRIQDFINRNVFLRAGVSVNYNVSGIEFLNRQDQQSGGGAGGNLQDAFDPFGFLSRNSGLNTLVNRPPAN